MSVERISPTDTAGIVREWFETPVGATGGENKPVAKNVLICWVNGVLHGDETKLAQFIVRNGRLYYLPGWKQWTLHSSTAIETLAKLIEEKQ